MKARRIVFSLITAVILLALIRAIWKVSFTEVLALGRRCRWDYLGAALAAYSAAYLFRAVRFRVLLREAAPPVRDIIPVVALHNLFNMILPVRTGELSYIYLMRNRFNLPSAQGVASLAAARVLDLLCLMLFFSIGLVHYGGRLHLSTGNLIAAGVAILALAFAILFTLPRLAGLSHGVFRKVLGASGLSKKPLGEKLIRKSGEVVDAFRNLHHRKTLTAAFLASLVTWFGIFLTCYLVLCSFQVVSPSDLPFGVSIVGTTALNITCILPINSLGNLGTWEAGWAVGYIFVGMDEQLAIQTGFGSHVIIFGYGILLGFPAWIALRGRGASRKEQVP